MKLVDHVQCHAHCFVAMMCVCFGKTKERHHTLGIGRLNVRARLHENIRRPANKFFGNFAEYRRLTIFREIVFVRDVANHHGRFISLRFRIKRNVARDHALNLFLR